MECWLAAMPLQHAKHVLLRQLHVRACADMGTLLLGKRDAQLDMLARVLAARDEDGRAEDLPDVDGLPRQTAHQVWSHTVPSCISGAILHLRPWDQASYASWVPISGASMEATGTACCCTSAELARAGRQADQLRCSP